MTESLSATEWPSIDITMEGQKLIGRFFELVDQPENGNGKQLAEEVFAVDGELVSVAGSFVGSKAIAKSREHAWDIITSRRHDVAKVYASDLKGLDLLLIGELTARVSSGKEAIVGFTARIIMQETANGLRMKRYEAWSRADKPREKDQTPIKNLLNQS